MMLAAKGLETCIINISEKHDFEENKLPEFLNLIAEKTINSWLSWEHPIYIQINKKLLTKSKIDLYIDFCLGINLHYNISENTDEKLVLKFEMEDLIKNSYLVDNHQTIQFLNLHGEDLKLGFDKITNDIKSGKISVKNYCVTSKNYFKFGDDKTLFQILNYLDNLNFTIGYHTITIKVVK